MEDKEMFNDAPAVTKDFIVLLILALAALAVLVIVSFPQAGFLG